MTDLDRRALINHIDRLLDPWRGGASPGMSVGVVQGGELVAHRSAGLASIEHGVPIGAQTRFRIASVSKQFTCAAILLLAERDQLDIAAPARDWLPELPDVYAAITVAQLMQNSSGIRDMLEIMRQGGADFGVPVTAEALLEGICRQRTLNFEPGSNYLYSNSNFLLLGLIVERISGMKLEKFLDREIFARLGMTSTLHTPDVSVPVPHLASGYLPADGGFVRAQHGYAIGGEGGLVSSVTDLAIWARNAVTGLFPSPGVLAALEVKTPFTNGLPSRYMRGLLTMPYRGVATVSHSGLWPGYRTEFLRVPELDVAVIAIANHGGADPNLIAHKVLDLLLDRRGAPALPSLPPAAELAPLAGCYLDPETGATVDIAVSAEGVPTLTTNGMPSTAEATGDGALTIPRASSIFTVRAAGADAVQVELPAGYTATWKRVPPGGTLPDDLPGTYYSAEMAARWTITRQDGRVVLRVAGPVHVGAVWDVAAVQGDDLRVFTPAQLRRAWLDVRAERGADGTIAALVVNGGRAKRIRYLREA